MKQARRRNTAAAIDAMPRAQVGLFGPEHMPKAGASQWYTPAPLAQRIAAWSGLQPGQRVLEPAAGRGALMLPLPLCAWSAVELDPENFGHLVRLNEAHTLGPEYQDLWLGDFLTMTPHTFAPYPNVRADGYVFDACMQNPPYEGNLDCDFVLHALDFAPRVIALLRSAFRHGDRRWERVWRWVDCTRRVELVDRPSFGSGIDGDSPMSDFAVFELRKRAHARERGEVSKEEVSWW